MSLNVNGIGDNKTKNGRERLKKKIRCIKNLIEEYKINIIMMQELKVHHNAVDDVNVNWKKIFPDFEFYSNDGKETGILVHKKLQQKEIDDLSVRIGNDQWSTWVMICNSGGKNIAITSYYRSPSSDGDTKEITKEINEIKEKYHIKSFMVCGDFNARFCGVHDQITENVIKCMDDNQFVCVNDINKTHVRQRDRSSDGIVDILGYNSVDIVWISQDLIPICNEWTTNSFNVFNGDIDDENVANCEMDSDWVANMSDHFAMIWRMNCRCVDDNKRITWRLNSLNWEDYKQKLETYMQ